MWLAFVALIALRLMIGFHFYREGTTKLVDGDFTAEYFLSGARGPLAPLFHQMLDDADGSKRLCVEQTWADETNVEGEPAEVTPVSMTKNRREKKVEINTELTFSLWEDQLERAGSYYKLGDLELAKRISQRREELEARILEARASQNPSIDTAELGRLRAEDEQSILIIRRQEKMADEILETHKDLLTEWLTDNRTEIISHYQQADRLDGFDRDGENRKKVATYVTSISDQVTEIGKDRNKVMAGWKSEVGAIWDSYEAQIRNLAVDEQAEKEAFELHRPFDQDQSMLKVVNMCLPWFDTIIGVLLILGLFTRIAAIAGAGFLASVVATQPPWIPGTTDTIYQSIELFGLLVLFATCAGRFGGLDFFFSPKNNENEFLNSEGQS